MNIPEKQIPKHRENLNQKNKPKSAMREKLDAFLDFKKSPTLKLINDAYAAIPTDQEAMNFIMRLPKRAKEYLENKNLEKLATVYQKGGVTNQYIKYAGRKLLLRNEIQSLTENTTQEPEVQKDNLSYLYGKYERFLCDKVAANGATSPKIQYMLYQISLQKKLQEKAKSQDKNEFIRKYFSGVKYEGELPEFEMEYLPIAINIKTSDFDLVQNLYHSKLINNEEETRKSQCGGFYIEKEGLNIIVEFIDANNDYNTDTKTHELFHAEMSLQNPANAKNLEKTNIATNLTSQICKWNEKNNINKNLKTFFDSIKLRINEEVMAFFSEPNHDFTDKSFEYYFAYYGIENSKFNKLLSENKNLAPENKALITNSYKQMETELKSSIFELKNALQIMYQKGYPKDWILNSLCSTDKPPVFLENTSPKALAMSLPKYDPQKVEKQQKTFEKISGRHQKRLDILKNSMKFSVEFMSDINKLFLGERFFGRTGIFSSKPQFDFLMTQIKDSGPVSELIFANHIQDILQKSGDTQATRQAITIKLEQLLDEAKAKYAVPSSNINNE
ncbi:MAG: hypothetical protein H7196_04250 [candidate division SR1 bacterium]|nr:hypothetical protein [candidate division SR1 bacterium]